MLIMNGHNIDNITLKNLDVNKFEDEHEFIRFVSLIDDYTIEEKIATYLCNKLGYWEKELPKVDIILNGSDCDSTDLALFYFIKKNKLYKKKREELKTLIVLGFDYEEKD